MNENKPVVVTGFPSKKVCTNKNVQVLRKIPQEILDNKELQQAVSLLPANYNFEIYKTIWQVKRQTAKRVALQFPEGLLLFSLHISDIINKFTGAETVILGDVTYGACCIDDLGAQGLGCDFLVHYGHSCLVPIDTCSGLRTMYVFVDIKIDVLHLQATLESNFSVNAALALVGTIQFASSLRYVAEELVSKGFSVKLPQSKPLSPGEILGCTSPRVEGCDTIIYVGDGRFHMESIMIANPGIKCCKYDPYIKKLTSEHYDHKQMILNRKEVVSRSKLGGTWGLILGTLGRQGSPKVLQVLQEKLKCHSQLYVTVLLSEIFPDKLNLFPDVDVWVQVACPRLSIDWGKAFSKPLLTPYEAAVAIGLTDSNLENYPMDYYSNNSRGPWTPNYKPS